MAIFIFTLASLPVPAEQTLADADWFERELGDGVVWRYYLFEDLFDARQSVSYIEVNLNNPNVSVEIPYLETGREKTSSMIQSQFPGAVAGINGTYFNIKTGGHRTYLRVEGTEIPPGGYLFSPWGYEAALALDASDNATIEQMPAGGWVDDTTHPNIIACGPLLIADNTIPSAHLSSIGGHSTNRHPRSAIGITSDNHLILLTVDGRTEMAAGMSCQELAEVMQQLGCPDAFNLDGGGSTTLWGAGELFNGVLNYPSDNGTYDHSGERSCSNAVCIESTAPSPKTWDARLTTKDYPELMDSGSQETATLVYENIGTSTWSAADTRLILARPVTRTSDLYDPNTWTSPSQPAIMNPSSVAPGEKATFTFQLQAPQVSTTSVYDEHFMLNQAGVGRIGPADSEAWMKIVVQPPVTPGESFIVESREGGQNYGWYSDSGMANAGADCTAPGCTGHIGMRYGSTYRSVAGLKKAIVAPDFPEAGYYNVYVAWGSGSNRRNPITYHVNHSVRTDTFQLDQTSIANVWMQLGSGSFYFNEGFSGTVDMTNEDIDVSGSMYAGAVKFDFQVPESPDKTYVVNHLGTLDPKPVIDGQAGAGEWDAASTAGTGFVAHNNPTESAAEDGAFQVLFDDSYLYILFRMNNAYLAGYDTPPDPYGFYDLPGDKINFFLTPFGISTEPFHRILFCPNPTDGRCYLWTQAAPVKTQEDTVGTDWKPGGDLAYTYVEEVLIIEYRVSWKKFDYSGISVPACPADGDTWGVQPCISNEISPGNWEYVNWEPDDTPSYIFGNPFGALVFSKIPSLNDGWVMY